MKRVSLLMVVSALLVTLGFAQTPDAGSNTDKANLNGCLGGSDGNYTVAEEGTGQTFKITASSVDLTPHLGHALKLTGHKANGAVSSGASDNSFAVTELTMISEHCAVAVAPAAAAPIVTVIPSSETVIATAPVSAAPNATISTPASDNAAAAVTVIPSSETVIAPAPAAAAPNATVSTPISDGAAPAVSVIPSSATVIAPAANAAQPTRLSAHPRRLLATQAEAATVPATTVSPSSGTVSPPAADAVPPAATASPSSETVDTPAAAATPPAVTHRAGSLWLLIPFVVLAIVLGTLVPLLGRWRKRKIPERTGTPNLSFTNEASFEGDKPEPRKVA
jgi:hypothetical protein